MKKWLKWLIAVLAFLILIFIAYYLIMNSDRAIEKAKEEFKNGFDCSSDSLNCNNFGSQKGAQSAYDYCMEREGKDIHNLDNDGDGVVCEGLK
jgi:hypothetical protein